MAGVEEEISIQPLKYLQSIFMVNTVSLSNYSNPGFDDEPGLKFVIAPATKAQQNTENTGVHQMSQLHQNQGKLKLHLEKKSHPALFVRNCVQSSCSKSQGTLPGSAAAAPTLPGEHSHGSTTLLAHHGWFESPGGWKWSPRFKRLQNTLS